MNFHCRWARLRKNLNATKFQFVNVELDLAITYCVIAAASKDQARSCRNIANAERAYCAAAYFLDGNLDAAQNREIKAKLERFLSLRTGCDGSTLVQ